VHLRAAVTGHRRTAEELGRALPGVPVRTSGRDEVLASVPGTAALVVATPGAEPVADGGYGAVLLLDGWAMLGRPDLRAGEETLRRWCAAAALARPAQDGGRVVVMADAGLGPVQALVRWDPAGYVAREAAERAELGFPPAVRLASVEGSAQAVADLLDSVELPDGADVLGPVPVGPEPPAVRPGAGTPPTPGTGAGQVSADGAGHPTAVGSGRTSVGGAGGVSAGGAGRPSAVGVGRTSSAGGAGRETVGESGPEPGGPVGHDRERALIRVSRERGAALAAALKAARGALDARKAPPVRIQLDPQGVL
jgi:primosomal protein N' (replication factor Y)